MIHTQLQRTDSEGYTTVTRDPLLSWLGGKSRNFRQADNENEVEDVHLENLTLIAEQNIHQLSIPERRTLAKSWFKEWRENEAASLFEALDHAGTLRGGINAAHED